MWQVFMVCKKSYCDFIAIFRKTNKPFIQGRKQKTERIKNKIFAIFFAIYCDLSQNLKNNLLFRLCQENHILNHIFFCDSLRFFLRLIAKFAYFRKQRNHSMEKSKLIAARHKKGYSQEYVANLMSMDVSNYNRREKGLCKISFKEWEKFAEIYDEHMEDIYQPDVDQVFNVKDSATVNYQGNNHIYSIPEPFLETQQKYIKILEEKVELLEKELAKQKK
jgi:transcriptional regulator with XRE-family HTH domain